MLTLMPDAIARLTAGMPAFVPGNLRFLSVFRVGYHISSFGDARRGCVTDMRVDDDKGWPRALL